MKRALVLYSAVLSICLLTLPLAAQTEQPPVDIFGAYSHTSNFDVGQSGWLASANYDLSHWLGIEGDVSGAYGHKDLGTIAAILPGVPNRVNSRMHSFNFGPRITYRAESGKFNGFGHLLFGVGHTNISATGADESDTAFSWVLGGGGDYNLLPRVAARLQLDLLHTNFFNRGDNHPRVSIGLVYRLGSR